MRLPFFVLLFSLFACTPDVQVQVQDTLPPCVEHPQFHRVIDHLKEAGAQTSFAWPDIKLQGTFNVKYVDGSEWQQEQATKSYAFVNQLQTSVHFITDPSQFDPTAHTFLASFVGENGCYAFLGTWGVDFLEEGEVAVNFAGIQERFLGTNNEGYIQYCGVHEILHQLYYFHNQDLSNPEYEIYVDAIRRPLDICGIMQYSTLRDPVADCPHPHNWRMTQQDVLHVWEDFGKPEGNVETDIDAFEVNQVVVPPPITEVDPCDDDRFMSLYADWVRVNSGDLREYEKYRPQIQRINLILLNL